MLYDSQILGQHMNTIPKLIIGIVLLTALCIIAQTRDAGKYIESKNEFFEKIMKSSNEFYSQPAKERKVFKADFAQFDIPKSVEEFNYYWHNDPVISPQGNTGMCWDYCATSFYESEIFRLRKEKIKLSEAFTAYWEYVEKARRFVKERGSSLFAQGSESNAIPRLWTEYGIVPLQSYNGLKTGQTYHDHTKMFNEMKSYLDNIQTQNAWNEEAVLSTIKSILNFHMGEPPAEFILNGKNYTPQTYFKDIVRIDFENYFDFQSTIKQPFYTYTDFEVPDNWWHSKDYINIPLDEFMVAIKGALKNGFTVCIGGDVSEPGYDGYAEAAVIPSFDIPSEFIDEYAREFRIASGTTEDDHGIHLVGYKESNEKSWFLIKDSGSGSRNGANVGYYFYHEDYIKLKMLSFSVHKDAVKNLLEKLK